VYNGTANMAGSGPVWIRLESDQTCRGDEASIEACKDSALWEHDHHCSHAEDVAISCAEEDDVSAYDAYEVQSNLRILCRVQYLINMYCIRSCHRLSCLQPTP